MGCGEAGLLCLWPSVHPGLGPLEDGSWLGITEGVWACLWKSCRRSSPPPSHLGQALATELLFWTQWSTPAPVSAQLTLVPSVLTSPVLLLPGVGGARLCPHLPFLPAGSWWLHHPPCPEAPSKGLCSLQVPETPTAMGPESSFNKPHAQLYATLIYSLAHAQDSTFKLTQI